MSFVRPLNEAVTRAVAAGASSLGLKRPIGSGWGTRIRTWTNGVRVRSSTVKLSPTRASRATLPGLSASTLGSSGRGAAAVARSIDAPAGPVYPLSRSFHRPPQMGAAARGREGRPPPEAAGRHHRPAPHRSSPRRPDRVRPGVEPSAAEPCRKGRAGMPTSAFGIAYSSKGEDMGGKFVGFGTLPTILVDYDHPTTVNAGLTGRDRHARTSVLPCSIPSFALR